MSTSTKSSKEAAAAVADYPVVDAFTPVYTKSVARFAELQKEALDVVAEQNAEFLKAWKTAFQFVPNVPGAFAFDVVGQTVDKLVETTKGAVDLAVEQSQAVAGIAKERTNAYGKIACNVNAIFQQSVEKTVEAQKKVLEFATEQNKAAFENAKKQFGAVANPAAAATESFQRGAEAFIETQKALLEIASKPLKAVANKA
jgi:hypothetical protein